MTFIFPELFKLFDLKTIVRRVIMMGVYKVKLLIHTSLSSSKFVIYYIIYRDSLESATSIQILVDCYFVLYYNFSSTKVHHLENRSRTASY
jgi:hypothetical protein